MMLFSMVGEDAQFIIATHSPILMAYPGATILSMDGETIEAVEYEDLDHVQIMRGFLNHPERYLGRLFGQD